MRICSLFAGIGGFDLAARWMNWQTDVMVEIKPFNQKVLSKNFPEAHIHGDIKTFDATPYRGTIDLVCGGFPCQDISSAWDGPGLAGERSGLWFEYRRVISEILPRWVVIENVANLKKRGLSTVIKDLAGLGYNADWAIIPASNVGAPHERKRIWIVGWREWTPVKYAWECTECECCEEPFCETCGVHYWECSCPGPHSDGDGWTIQEETFGLVAYPNRTGFEQQRRAGAISPELITAECLRRWAAEPGMGRVVNGVPSRVDRLSALGNAIVPQVAYWVFKAIEAAATAFNHHENSPLHSPPAADQL